MRDPRVLQHLLDAATVDESVLALCPDYRALLIVVDGIEPGPGDVRSEALLRDAEQHARALLREHPVEALPHVAAWREAYRAFGAKPQRTRNSLEALLRRADAGLPRVNRLTDVYNAISVRHGIPIGGEDLDHYAGSARLRRAVGVEPFETVADGATAVEHPEPGEVVWCDDAGVTCRRWNWRQTSRTQLTASTRAALFILDALDPVTDGELSAAGAALAEELRRLGSDIVLARRLISASSPAGNGD